MFPAKGVDSESGGKGCTQSIIVRDPASIRHEKDTVPTTKWELVILGSASVKLNIFHLFIYFSIFAYVLCILYVVVLKLEQESESFRELIQWN